MINKKLLNQLWFAYIAALILWLILTYGDTAKAFLDNRYFAYEKDGDIYTCDFILYYNNGILAWEAFKNHINIYDGLLQNQYLEKLTGLELKKIFYSQYPPYLFVLMMPLPLADMKLDWVLWELGAMGLMIYSLWGLLRISLEGKFTRAFSIIAAIASFPAWICFRLGQIALLIYPAFIWYWLMLERQKWFTAGLLGGFCLLKLQYLPIMFLTGIFLGGRRFFLGYATTGTIYLLASGFILGWQNVLGYPQALKYGEISGKVTGVAPESQQNLRGQLVALLHNDGSMVHLIAFAVWILASLIVAYFWWKESKRRKELGDNDPHRQKRFMLLSSITVFVLLISSPHTHRQDFVFTSLSCFWMMHCLVGHYPLQAPPIAGDFKPAVMLSLRYLIIGFPLLSWAFYLSSYFFPVLIQPFFAWAIIIVVLVLVIVNQGGGLERIFNKTA